MAKFLIDFPPGALDTYRKSASFDWKDLQVFLDGEDLINFKHRLHMDIKEHFDQFQQCPGTITLDEQRRIANKNMKALKMIYMKNIDETSNDSFKKLILLLTFSHFNQSAVLKASLNTSFFVNAVKYLGSERHQHYLSSVGIGNVSACFCLTEIAHGSNTKGMRTTATYDVPSKQFIINSPDFEAAKCWSGSLGHTATHAVLFAHLITPDGVHQGLHTFIVQIRDPQTMESYPGLTICDMGEKNEFNGVDNGYIIFHNFGIPRENLLNKVGDVTEDGMYVTQYTDPLKRHGAALGTLSIARILITMQSFVAGTKAICIAIRYAAVRKQFGIGELNEEIPILEYQSLQLRLLPYLAYTYVLQCFARHICNENSKYLAAIEDPANTEDLSNTGLEFHGLTSACKGIFAWTVHEVIQSCREACAGHGYLKVAGLGELLYIQDASLTVEGANMVLIQQTSNWLLKYWGLVLKGRKISTPLHSIDFLTNAKDILSYKFSAVSVEEIARPQNILDMLQWLICYLLKETHEKYMENMTNGGGNMSKESKAFWAKNNVQVFYANSISQTYIQHFALQCMLARINEATNASIKNVLLKLFALYGVWILEKYIATFYMGEYATGPNIALLLQDAIIQLCAELKNDAVALVDVIAPPDILMASPLGMSDGQVYKYLEESMLQSPEGTARPNWWRKIVNWKDRVQSKL